MAQELEIEKALNMEIPTFSGKIIVAGSGRSGTTWIGNIIAGDEYRIIFEPLDYRHVPEAEGLGLRPYFRPQGSYPRWYPFIKKMLTGQIENEWVDQDRNRLNSSTSAKGIVVKEIRANGMLGWIDNNFQCRIVYIIRNPWSVIASRLKLGWETHIDAFLSQQELMEDHLAPYKDVMMQAETDVQKHAVMWCVENLIPMRQMQGRNWLFCRYEDLVAGQEHEVARLIENLGLDFTGPRKLALEETSRTDWNVAASDQKNSPLNIWQAFLSDSEKKDIAGIVRSFGISCYDTENIMPLEKC